MSDRQRPRLPLNGAADGQAGGIVAKKGGIGDPDPGCAVSVNGPAFLRHAFVRGNGAVADEGAVEDVEIVVPDVDGPSVASRIT